jgi:hypothetical protein
MTKLHQLKLRRLPKKLAGAIAQAIKQGILAMKKHHKSLRANAS